MEITGNEINIQIARELGVLRVTHLDGKVYYDGYDYVNDLNAMHEVENKLTYEQRRNYVSAVLGNGTWEEWWGDLTDTDKIEAVFMAARAPARDRAEAFLMVINQVKP